MVRRASPLRDVAVHVMDKEMDDERSRDAFMTPDEDAVRCTEWLADFMQRNLGLARNRVTNVLEPTAGAGAFVKAAAHVFPRASVTAYDLEPKHPRVARANFLETKPLGGDRRCTTVAIGNPPFEGAVKGVSKTGTKRNFCGGSSSEGRRLMNAIVSHAAKSAAVLGFIVPRSFLKKSYMRRYPESHVLVSAEPTDIVFPGTKVITSFVVLVDPECFPGRAFVKPSPPPTLTEGERPLYEYTNSLRDANVAIKVLGMSIRETDDGWRSDAGKRGSEAWKLAERHRRNPRIRDPDAHTVLIRARDPERFLARFRSGDLLGFMRQSLSSHTRINPKKWELDLYMAGQPNAYAHNVWRIRKVSLK